MTGPGLDPDTLVAGRYRVRERVGAGGMGVVYRAFDTRLKRDVALKRMLLGDLEDDEAAEARRRTLREAEIAARVHHPRIVSIFDVLDEPGGPLLVQEYVPSRSLSAVVAEVGAITPGAAARAGAQIAEALAAAHLAEIVHRDVKPGNALVGPGDPVGPVKLADFGISHLPGNATPTSLGVGTPPYFSPEIARGEQPTAAGDVYALGATLCAVLQGAPPFGWTAGNPLELIRRIAHDPVPAPTVGGPIGELVARLTDGDPARRPTAARAASELWALADRPEPLHPAAGSERPGGPGRGGSGPGTDGSGTGPGEPTRDRPVPARPWYRRRPVPVALGLVVVAAVAAGVVVTSDGGGSGDAPAAGFPASIPPIAVADERTADPCSLIDPAVLRRFGQVALMPDYGNFANCTARIVPPGTPDALRDVDAIGVAVQFHPPTDPMPEGVPEQVGAGTVFREPAERGGCHRTIGLADQTYMDVSASFTGANVPLPDTCAVAEAATAAAATVLAEHGVGRRTPPSEGLWSRDACALLTAGDLAFLTPYRQSRPRRGFAGWKCDWDAGDDDGPQVTISFDRYDPPSESGSPVPGTAVFVSPDEPRRCNAEIVKRSFPGPDGRPLAEELRVLVQGPGGAGELCRRASALAVAADGRT